MAKFRLQCGTVVLVDDCDAYLLRNTVWRSKKRGRNQERISIVTGMSGEKTLSHAIAGSGHERVVHLNGDDLDHRRANLRGMTRNEFSAYIGLKLNEGRELKRASMNVNGSIDNKVSIG